MPSTKHRKERLTALVVAGLVFFNYPLLSVFSGDALLFGIPVVYVYLFVAWAGFIGAAALVVELGPKDE